MKTPTFWNEPNKLSNLLWPFSVVYEMASTLRRSFTTPVVLPVPVICVGNLTAGGAGKTPVALHIGKLLKDKNINAFFLSRGYGGTLKGPLAVKLGKHTALEVGDEPLLLAKLLPTIVAKDRVSGARLAVAQGAKVIIMDDGYQNPTIAKTLSLVIIDGHTGFGNGRILPAGPLRESPDTGLSRAHAAIIIDRTPAAPPLPKDYPTLFAKTQLTAANALKGVKTMAFCGIGNPQKFFTSLANLGISPVETIAFPDHHLYSASDWRKLVAKANKHQAVLVTTAKDAVRLPASLQREVAVVDVALAFDNPALLDAILDYAIENAKT